MIDERLCGLSPQDITQILDVIEASAFDSIELKIGDLELFASKSGAYQPNRAAPLAKPTPAPAPAPAAMQTEGQSTSAAGAKVAQTHVAAGATPPDAAVSPTEDADDETEEHTAITAPVVGTFYIAPDPEASPFIDIGDRVTPETTVGLIEVMKTFIDVKAGCSGRITRRLVENTAGVEFGQRLFLVRSDTE